MTPMPPAAATRTMRRSVSFLSAGGRVMRFVLLLYPVVKRSSTTGCTPRRRRCTLLPHACCNYFADAGRGPATCANALGGVPPPAGARGDAVVIMTADLETPPEALPAIMQKLEQGYDMVATTRWRRGITLNGYPPVKFVLNFLFQQIFRVLYMTKLSDLTYGYRAFRIGVVKSIRWEEARHPFFFETMLKPLRLGYTIAEVDAP